MLEKYFYPKAGHKFKYSRPNYKNIGQYKYLASLIRQDDKNDQEIHLRIKQEKTCKD